MLATLTSRRDHNFRVLDRKEKLAEILNSSLGTKELGVLLFQTCYHRESTTMRVDDGTETDRTERTETERARNRTENTQHSTRMLVPVYTASLWLSVLRTLIKLPYTKVPGTEGDPYTPTRTSPRTRTLLSLTHNTKMQK